ncbi:MAG: GNAT family N-acetyltransferase [Trueperaceae bacterium]|nr:GNAT family N-acetyltransferase [Trueperaceae bacterium]
MKVHPYRPADFAGAYSVCLATGDAGEDATGTFADPNLLGHLYVGPYLALEPRHAFVLREGDEVLGYALGALDTATFEARCEARWWPPLRAMYPRRAQRPAADAALVASLHDPPRTPPARLEGYPSHLHLDLLPPAQGRGFGRRMMEAVLASLFDAGSRGVHLGVARRNHRAIGFYRHLGFRDLEDEEDACIMGLLPPEAPEGGRV